MIHTEEKIGTVTENAFENSISSVVFLLTYDMARHHFSFSLTVTAQSTSFKTM